jgi:hypothetical protein
MDPEERAEIGDMPRLQVSMKVRVIALSGAFLLLVALGLYASSPLISRCLEAVKQHMGPNTIPTDDEQNDTDPDAYDLSDTSVELTPFIVLEEDFLTQDPHWFWPPFNHSKGTRSVTVRNGSVFLNLTDEVDGGSQTRVYMNDRGEERGNRWLYVDVEIRLRCTDDNSQNSDVGKGHKSWGLMDNHPGFPRNDLIFKSNSPESDPDLAGLQAYAKINGGSKKFSQSLVGVDIREWHNYTILWRPGNATFLVDDEVVSSTHQAPSTPMAIAIHSENYAVRKNDGDISTGIGWLSFLDLEVNQSIEVDYIKVSMDEGYYKEYSNQVNDIFINFSSLIETVDARGLNSTVMRKDLESSMVEWNETGYLHGENYMTILSVCDLKLRLDSICYMFKEASEMIASANYENNDDASILEGLYKRAEDAWLEYNFDQVENMLELLIEWN